MADQPYHGDVQYVYEDFSSQLDSSALLDKIQEMLDNINPDDFVVSLKQLLGDGTLEDGGVYGKILKLSRVHLGVMKEENELTEESAGNAYSSLLSTSLQYSLDYLFRGVEAKSKANLDMLLMLTRLNETDRAKAEMLNAVSNAKTTAFDLEYIKPKEHELIKENIEAGHANHLISSYRLDNLLPKELESLTIKNESLTLEKSIRQYYKDNIQNEEKLSIVADRSTKEFNLNDILPIEKEILAKNSSSASIEQDIREYYRDDIQPEEKNNIVEDRKTKEFNLGSILPAELDILQARDSAMGVEQGIREYYASDMQPEEKLTLIANRSIAEKTLELKEYELDTMMPEQVNLLVQQVCSTEQDCKIKKYQLANIYPEEWKITVAKRVQERVNAGWTGNTFVEQNSLPYVKKDQLKKQSLLYIRQRDSYDEQKYQQLLNTQVNYASMIFADAEVPEVLEIGKGHAVTSTFNMLTVNNI